MNLLVESISHIFGIRFSTVVSTDVLMVSVFDS